MKWAPFMLPGGIKRVPYPLYFINMIYAKEIEFKKRLVVYENEGELGDVPGDTMTPRFVPYWRWTSHHMRTYWQEVHTNKSHPARSLKGEGYAMGLSQNNVNRARVL